MKLRIQGNSLRMRLSQSEMARFVEAGSIKETVYFGRESGAEFTYVLISDESKQSVHVASSPQGVTVHLPRIEVAVWSATKQVGIAGEVDLGDRGLLSVLVEKDFACLDRSGDANADTFPNPLAAHVC